MNMMKINRKFLVRAALVLTIGFVVYTVVSLQRTNQQLGEQVKGISEENRELNRQNLTYMRCLASIFATYTQNGIPITIESLDTCTVKTVDGKPIPVTNLPATTGEGTQETTTTPITSPTFSAPKSESSQQTEQTEKPPEPVKVLGLPLCVPLTQLCVK